VQRPQGAHPALRLSTARAVAALPDMLQQVTKRPPRATDEHEQTALPLPGSHRWDRLRANRTRAAAAAEMRMLLLDRRANSFAHAGDKLAASSEPAGVGARCGAPPEDPGQQSGAPVWILTGAGSVVPERQTVNTLETPLSEERREKRRPRTQ